MTVHDVDGLNAGYASALLEQYLENPDGAPDEWRALFESGASDLVATHPGLARLVQLLREDGILRVHVPGETLADVLPQLQQIYCGTSAYEIEHISDHEQRVWLRTVIESRRYHHTLGADDKRRLLERLTEVEGFERYLRRAFLGQKQFSVEGLDVMIPM